MSCGAFNEQDIEEAFTFLEASGLPMFDAREVRCMLDCLLLFLASALMYARPMQLYPCEELLGEMLAHWKKRQLKLQKDVKQVRPFIATS